MEDKSSRAHSRAGTIRVKAKAAAKATVKTTPAATVKMPVLEAAQASAQNNKACCCGSAKGPGTLITQYGKNDCWITGEIGTEAGNVPQVSTKLTFQDTLGTWKIRWGIGRMSYKVNPGIYAIGKPDKSSPVLVTANYKLTFDTLRKELDGLQVWLLVLDTKGINVWCAAGKGTFGTTELIRRIEKTGLSGIVAHKTLILPQLGAPGVSAHVVSKNTGFKIVYGPVRAEDIKEFLASGMVATEEMRSVRFDLKDRLVLTPVELTAAVKPALPVLGILFLINLLAAKPFGLVDLYAYGGSLLAGCVLTPVLLPWIPGRAFAWKGWLMGLLWTFAVLQLNGGIISPGFGMLKELGYILVLPAVSAFYAMNFTGSSTYTSFSGVLKEMKRAIPLIIISIVLGSLLLLADSLLKF